MKTLMNKLILNNIYKSSPSLRGDVNGVDRGELKIIDKWEFKKKNVSTPPSGKPDTSPQGREGLRKVCLALLQDSEELESLPSLRGDVRRTEGS